MLYKELKARQKSISQEKQVNGELLQQLLKVRVECQAAHEIIEDKDGELSHKEQQLMDLRDITEERGDRIRKLIEEKEVTTKEVSV